MHMQGWVRILAEVAVAGQGKGKWYPCSPPLPAVASSLPLSPPRALPCARHPPSVLMAPQEVSPFPAPAEVVGFLGFTSFHLFAFLVFSLDSSWFGVFPGQDVKSLCKFSSHADVFWFTSVSAGCRFASFPAKLLDVSCTNVYNPVYCLTVQKNLSSSLCFHLCRGTWILPDEY